MNQKKIKFGVIGADPDLRANFIFKNFPREKGELIVICDHDPEMQEEFRKRYPEFADIKMYADQEVQAVFNAVRNFWHEEMLWRLSKRAKQFIYHHRRLRPYSGKRFTGLPANSWSDTIDATAKSPDQKYWMDCKKRQDREF